MPTCRIKNEWGDIECNLEALESGGGYCILHLLGEKDESVFNKALLKKLEDEDYNFSAVVFPGDISIFKGKTFNKPVLFVSAIFSGKVDFSETNFSFGVDFSATYFQGDVIFVKSRFDKTVTLRWTKFLSKVDFSKSYFFGDTYFDETIFNIVNFREAKIYGTFILDNINYEFDVDAFPITTRKWVGQIHSLFLGPNALVKLINVDLYWVSFLETDLRRIIFHNVDWRNVGGRNVLYDETFLKRSKATQDQYRAVEQLYRHLYLNLEREGDLKSSGDFHYGEMELHRRASPWRWFPLYWYNLYWLSSGYGEIPLRALFCLFGMLIFFAGAFFWFEPGLANRGILEGLGQSLLFTFQQGTLQRPDWFKPASIVGRILASIIPVIIPGQTALFFLALRNRLGRRR